MHFQSNVNITALQQQNKEGLKALGGQRIKTRRYLCAMHSRPWKPTEIHAIDTKTQARALPDC